VTKVQNYFFPHRISRALQNGELLAALLVFFYIVLFVISVYDFPLFGPLSTADEQLAFYTGARNFERYGFLNSLFLQDLSTSTNPAHHPFVYTHMPPGPEIFIAGIRKLLYVDYRGVRVIFAVISLAGLGFYLEFVRKAFSAIGLRGYGYVLLFVGPPTVLHGMDHPVDSFFLLFSFLPLFLVRSFYKNGVRWKLHLAYLTVFFSSIYLRYDLLIMILVFWGSVYRFLPLRFDFNHWVIFVSIVFSGFVLHMAQNVFFLGLSVVIQDFFSTLSSRMFGFSNELELKRLLQTAGIVSQGTHVFNFEEWLREISRIFHLPFSLGFIPLLGLLVREVVQGQVELVGVALLPAELPAVVGENRLDL